MTENDKSNFLKMVESLKRYQRADLYDGENNIIEKLYTDPLSGDFILTSMLQEQTTLLIGRKGTGKSTIINRFQHEVRKQNNKISLYLDVKSIYLQAIDSPFQGKEEVYTMLSPEEKNKYFLYNTFLKTVIQEIKTEVQDSLFKYKFNIFSQKITKEVFEEKLKVIFNKQNNYVDVTALKTIKSSHRGEEVINREVKQGVTSTLQPELSLSDKGVSAKIGSCTNNNAETNAQMHSELTTDEYASVLVKYFNIIELMNEIKDLLKSVGIEKVFICLDDASELEKGALETFMRTLVVPFNNASNEFFKFKISFYPGRDLTPEIDRQKIDTLNLDYFNLYSVHNKDKMEDYAIEYTKRLLTQRFKHYFGENVKFDDFFEVNTSTNIDSYFKTIFYTSSNIPRFMGKILWYAYRQSISVGKKITKNILLESAKLHYVEDLKDILYRNQYIEYKNYNEKAEKEHLKNLLMQIIEKAKDNKRLIASSEAEIFKDFKSHNAPSNYLYFIPEYELLLSTLELNSFITKYTQQKDRGSGSGNSYLPPKEVSVYILNYGLCRSEDIVFDEGETDRKFRLERVFDFNLLINQWANNQKEIYCPSCHAIHSLENLEAIKKLGMICENCGKKGCIERTKNIQIPEAEIQIPEIQFKILSVLRVENTGLRAKDIGLELDLSSHTIGAYLREDRSMRKQNYVDSIDGKYYITKNALSIFFQ